MSIRSIVRWVALTITSCTFALALSTCGGGKKGSVVQGFSPGFSVESKTSPEGLPAMEGLPAEAGLDYPESDSLDDALVELDALERPQGVDEALWTELKDALTSQLESRFSNRDSSSAHSRLESRDSRFGGKLVSTPPTGEANRVTDLAITDNGGGTYTLSWHYRNLGDYDQNGTVGISDITPIAMHYNETYTLTDVNCLLAVIDGSGNGVVDIADITPLAINYGVDCEGYNVEGDDTWQSPFNEVDTISLGEATGAERKQFAYMLNPPEYDYYRVVPKDSVGVSGEPSSIAAIHGGEGPSIISVSPTAGLVGSEVTFTAEVSGDAPFIYQWNFGGGATPDTSTEQSPTVTLGDAGTYSASVSASNAFGDDIFNFALVITDAQPPSILAVSPTEGDSGTEVTFSCAVSGDPPFTYNWDFDGGTEPDTSSDPTPSVVLGLPGEYNALVSVENVAGEDTYPFALTVNSSNNPPEVLSVTPTEGEKDSTLQFSALVTGTRPLSYAWDFGGGGTPNTSSQAMPAVTLGDFGEYDASLTVTNAFGKTIYPFALTIPARYEEWMHTWGRDGWDHAFGLAVDGNGCVYVTGYTAGLGSDQSDVLLLKYDSVGSLLWAKTWSGSDGDAGSALAIDGSGNAYVTGYAGSSEAGPSDVILLKYDPNGNLLYQKTWGSGAFDYGYALALDGDGNVYITGCTESFGAGGHDIILLKYDSSGALLLQETWGGNGNDLGNALALDRNGNAYIAGWTNSFGAGSSDIILLKYSPSGSLLWQKSWGGSEQDHGYALSLDQSGNVFVTGDTASKEPSGYDVVLLKYSSSGSLLWQKSCGCSEYDTAYALAIDSSGYVYVAGYVVPNSNGEALILKFDSSGNIIWQRSWGGIGYDCVRALALDASGVPYVCGTAPNVYGEWQDLEGTTSEPLGSTSSPAGTVGVPSGTEDSPEGIETAPVGVEDTGGGSDDFLIMKLDPLYQ